MRNLIIISLLLTGVVACNSPASKESHQISMSESKTRIAQVQELSYRNMEISATIQEEIEADIKEIAQLIDPAREFQMFWKSDAGPISEVMQTWDSFSDLVNYSYNLWKINPIHYTCIAYSSDSQNVVSGKTDSFFVYQIEHKNLTGTIRIFVDPPMYNECDEIIYQERN